MSGLIFFGAPAALVGLFVGLISPPRRLFVPVLLGPALAVAFGLWGKTASGENAGGWLGAIIVGIQFVGFLAGTFLGVLIRCMRNRQQRTPSAPA
jgi:hypothetical protein